jgi:hypothetical protein
MSDFIVNDHINKQYYPKVKLRKKLTNTSLPESVDNDFNE